MKQSNEYTWDTYKIPQPDGSSSSSSIIGIDSGSSTIDIPPANATATATVAESETFSIRHLRAGRTGARKTWAAAPALLDYLVLKDGLRLRNNPDEKKIENGNDDDASSSVLDMAVIVNPDSPPAASALAALMLDDKPCNILELGGGSGYLSVGLAKALATSSPSSTPITTPSSSSSSSTLKIMCTDMDKHTIKNMRHNICANKETKTVAIEKLDWGEDVGGEKFDMALERKFKVRKAKVSTAKKSSNSHSNSSPPSSSSSPETTAATTRGGEVSHNNDDEDDPVRLLTHVIGSDVHFGETTLGPLSSVIASIKRRNRNVRVIIMMKERSANSAGELVEQIELKVNGGGERSDGDDGGDGDDDDAKEKKCAAATVVRVRDVIQSGVPDFRMKLIEC